MMRYATTLLFLLMTVFAFSQKATFQGQPVKAKGGSALAEQFSKWEIFQFDIQAFDAFVKQAGQNMEFNLKFGKHDWAINLQPRDIRSQHYVLTVLTGEGPVNLQPGGNVTFRGKLNGKGGGSVSLTIHEEFLYGFVERDEEIYLIEPLWYFLPDEPKDRFVIYAASDVKPKPGAKCGFDEMMERSTHQHDEETQQIAQEKMGCKEVELAIASDLLMYNKYGSVFAVEIHNIAVMNNVQTNYDNEFNDELKFEIVQQFVVSPPATDPWSNSTNASVLLSSFAGWGPSGFSQIHDIGQLWTNRNFQGGTIGIAYLSAVCTSSRYHCLQDFSSNANLLRVLTSHEIGHNFSATHDASGSPTIMAPAVNNTNTWSSQSLNQINNYYPNRPCLANCPSLLPPIASFVANPGTGCAPLVVSYTDQSLFGPTSWNWTFPGGTPSSSTAQNPVVTYAVPGTYSATLTASNSAGNNSITQTLVNVLTVPTTDFVHTQVNLTVIFTNLSSATATSFLWNFGDGNTSTEVNPIHTYAMDGFYTVTLTAFNACGSTPSVQVLPIFTQPLAGFTANPTTGCAGMTVNFFDQSSANSLTWSWSFPGGTPSSSSQQFPSVVYNAPGVYDVSLTVSNPAGSSTFTQTSYITVNTIPTPGFSSSVNGSTVTFNNSSSNATSYSWNFGDGNTSTATNPVHTYTGNGNFTVTLTATNACGPATISQTVTIEAPPVAGFSASTTSGCQPLTVQFNNSSSANSSSFNWSFPGGTPSSSTAESPTVVYNSPGTFSVSLIVTNSTGSDTLTLVDYITVAPLPVPGFTSSINGYTASFTNTSAHAVSYAWDFGDGSTSNQVNPVHTYATDGTYTVTLSATNDCGTVIATQTVTIVTAPTAGFSANVTAGCAPLTVQFNNESSDNAASFFWEFPGGNPATSNVENPVVTYQNPGTYTVTLTVTNTAGQSTSTQTNYIIVAGGPSAGFDYSSNNATVDFNNTSSNANSYEWDFGDGNTSTEENPEHEYATDGTYTVTLTVTNICGSFSVEQTVTVATLPTAGFSSNTTAGCAPLTVQFTNESSDNAATFAWEFPGGTPSTSSEENPVVVYSTGGVYSVTLTVSNAAGQSTATQTDHITVGALPAASFMGSVSGTTVDFTNNSSNATSYGWDFGDGNTSNEENPSHTYAGDGVYEVSLTATNDCGSVTVNGQFTVVTPPTAGFSAVQTSGCAPFTVQFNNESSANATTFSWSFPGGIPAASNEQSPTVTYNTPGVFSVTLTVGNQAGNDMFVLTDYITVDGPPSTGFNFSVNDATVIFQNTTTNATSFQWDFGDGNTSEENVTEYTYQADGVYQVTLTAKNDCGSTSFTQTVVIATQGPIAAFTAENTLGCAPLTVVFENLSSTNAEFFVWNFPGGTPATSTEANPTVTYSAPGTYDVELTAGNIQGSNTYTQPGYVVVNGVPGTGFTYTANAGTVTFANTSTGAVKYAWDFGDGNTSEEENPVHTYQQNGEYTVTLTAENECGFGSASIVVQVILTSAGEIPGIQVFNVFPNPNSGRFTVILTGEPMSSLELSFTNVLGQRLLTEKMDFGTGHLSKEYAFGDLPSGMYIFRVKSGDKSLFKKVIIE